MLFASFKLEKWLIHTIWRGTEILLAFAAFNIEHTHAFLVFFSLEFSLLIFLVKFKFPFFNLLKVEAIAPTRMKILLFKVTSFDYFKFIFLISNKVAIQFLFIDQFQAVFFWACNIKALFGLLKHVSHKALLVHDVHAIRGL